jgi:pSer/pThr/pTyr-binding forkhead associated (FHA) protein
MSMRHLVIDSKDLAQFFLLVEGDKVTIGGSRKYADTVLEHLRIARIHCELEVEGDHVALRGNGSEQGAPHQVRLGEVFDAGGSRLQLAAGPVGTAAFSPALEAPPRAAAAPGGRTGGTSSLAPVLEAPHQAAPSPATAHQPVLDTFDDEEMPGLREEAETLEIEEEESRAAAQPVLRKRLVCFDGADQGQSFLLPEAGIVAVGKDRNHSDIYLHDFHVSRLSCELNIDGDTVTVKHVAGVTGTLINNQRITEQVLRLGDVLRVGNTHMRLEVAVIGEEVAKVSGGGEEDDGPVEVVEDDAESVDAVEVVEDETEEEIEVVEDGEEVVVEEEAPESVRLLHVLREKLKQLAGHAFGHYRLGAVLGTGRTGVVFRAEHAETGQPVALKVFLPLFPHGDAELSRFARVMKGLLPLRHPNLVALAGAGKTGTYTWVAREFVEGESLVDVLRRLGKSQRLDWRLGYRLACQLGRALDFACKHHLRHGKITPANILLQRNDKGAKLADLMLGFALEGSRLWQAGMEHRPMSELAYLSPEQASPDAFVDELSDIYSLGAVIYALLTARPPFQADNTADLLEQIQGPAKPVRPSSLNSGIPVALDKIVLKMLHKRQEDRYQTPGELLTALEAVEEEEE